MADAAIGTGNDLEHIREILGPGRRFGPVGHVLGPDHIRRGLKVLGKFFLAERKSYLKQFEVPGLLVFGEYEMFFNPHKVARNAERVMPGLESTVVDAAGHGAIYDQPDFVNELVVRYLKR